MEPSKDYTIKDYQVHARTPPPPPSRPTSRVESTSIKAVAAEKFKEKGITEKAILAESKKDYHIVRMNNEVSKKLMNQVQKIEKKLQSTKLSVTAKRELQGDLVHTKQLLQGYLSEGKKLYEQLEGKKDPYAEKAKKEIVQNQKSFLKNIESEIGLKDILAIIGLKKLNPKDRPKLDSARQQLEEFQQRMPHDSRVRIAFDRVKQDLGKAYLRAAGYSIPRDIKQYLTDVHNKLEGNSFNWVDENQIKQIKYELYYLRHIDLSYENEIEDIWRRLK